jgi:hypothetical protein
LQQFSISGRKIYPNSKNRRSTPAVSATIERGEENEKELSPCAYRIPEKCEEKKWGNFKIV